MRKEINADLCHDGLVSSITPLLSFSENKDIDEQKNRLKESLISLTGIDEIRKNACPLNLKIEENVKCEGYTRIRFTFDSEAGCTVPCYLLIPSTSLERYPVAIVLQGHSTGFHLSIGENLYGADEESVERTSVALQAVRRGYAALAIEQRGMGERISSDPWHYAGERCRWESRRALVLGRTIIGERIWDISKAIDALSLFHQCDTSSIIVTGNSGGGTASFYSACYDERIKICAPSCSFCSYKSSILSIGHCECNYIPSSLKSFDMDDLALLVAPRTLIVIAGREDKIFPIEGVRESFNKVKKIYGCVGAEGSCALLETEKGHFWCEDIVWNAIDEAKGRLGW